MTEEKKWTFKKTYGKDILATRSGGSIRPIAETAATASGIGWKQVLNMPLKEFMRFINEFSSGEGLDEFAIHDFLGNE